VSKYGYFPPSGFGTNFMGTMTNATKIINHHK